ncbi:riboflavin synthase [Flavihumibacter sp. ZG627]|uniref:riboflavin synthase n=1 Tax=Flavihumibacter sp. ZG627 TaxID=1463156 RepID=UPI00057D21CF|nr:riboflavin synthase [Flavihumibacter sp. ZG627]KIC90347.1 riboflavin synthase subunit alpha [Flavihumibacter sp. ZG627]
MFTGIIETIGIVESIEKEGSNSIFWLNSTLSNTFKIDQSVAHNGVCLTIDQLSEDKHRVTAISETLEKTELGSWKVGALVNLERCMVMNGRIDGHIVQGHVDCTATCLEKVDMDGSWEFRFRIPPQFSTLIIEKGSICLNGISLTIFNVSIDEFSVAIIPYTFTHTNIGTIEVGMRVNIEFDIIGKYANRIAELKTTIK